MKQAESRQALTASGYMPLPSLRSEKKHPEPPAAVNSRDEFPDRDVVIPVEFFKRGDGSSIGPQDPLPPDAGAEQKLDTQGIVNFKAVILGFPIHRERVFPRYAAEGTGIDIGVRLLLGRDLVMDARGKGETGTNLPPAGIFHPGHPGLQKGRTVESGMELVKMVRRGIPGVALELERTDPPLEIAPFPGFSQETSEIRIPDVVVKGVPEVEALIEEPFPESEGVGILPPENKLLGDQEPYIRITGHFLRKNIPGGKLHRKRALAHIVSLSFDCPACEA